MAIIPQKTITGKLLLLDGTPNVGSVVFELENFGNNIPVVNGTCIVTTSQAKVSPDANGMLSITLWGNDVISPAGTYYVVSYYSDSEQLMGTTSYMLTGTSTEDLSGLIPIQSVNPIFPTLVVLSNPNADQTISGFKLNVPAGLVTASLSGMNGQPVSLPNGISTPSLAGLTAPLSVPSGINTPSITGLTAAIGLAVGGTGRNMTTTGGVGHFVRQNSLGGPIYTGIITIPDLPMFGGSGSGHSAGLVPDPGANQSITRYLREDGSWVAPAGTGTVTSIGISVPTWLQVMGSPVNQSGVITIAPASNQTANLFLATPDGINGYVSLRALAWADLPGVLPILNGGTGVNMSFTGGAGKILKQKVFGGSVVVETLIASDLPVFVGSGESHSQGAVPDPGVVGGIAKFLREDGTWANPVGSGTVTSVGISTPNWLQVVGSPITGNGVIGITATPLQAQNQFLGTPNGQVGAVNLRALVPADIPTITSAKIDDSVCSKTGTQTLSNKTLLAPNTNNKISIYTASWQSALIIGDGTKKTVYTVTIPAGVLQYPGMVKISSSMTHNGSGALQGDGTVLMINPATYTVDLNSQVIGTVTTNKALADFECKLILCPNTGNPAIVYATALGMNASVTYNGSPISGPSTFNVTANTPVGDSVNGLVFLVEVIS